MGRKVLLLIRSEAIYRRIVQDMSLDSLSGHLVDLPSVRQWLSQGNTPVAALLDPQWAHSEEVVSLLQRLHIRTTRFSGDFTEASVWVRNTIQSIDNGVPAEELIAEAPKDQKNPQVQQNPLLKRRRAAVESGSQTDVPKDTSITPQIVERIVEVPVETPVYIRESVLTTMSPRLVVVTSLWPRAGATFISLAIAGILSKQLPSEGVTLIEHPGQMPRLWEYFDFSSRVAQYTHWAEDGRGETLTLSGVGVVPIKPDIDTPTYEGFMSYIYRQLKRPLVIIDAGNQTEDDSLLETADNILLVLDCDPTLLGPDKFALKYRELAGRYEGKLHTILNKWTKFAQLEDPEEHVPYFPGAIKVPYMAPEFVQRAMWEGKFPTDFPEINEDLSILESKLLQPWTVTLPNTKMPPKQPRFRIPWKRRKPE